VLALAVYAAFVLAAYGPRSKDRGDPITGPRAR
jgi:hypothetical protein